MGPKKQKKLNAYSYFVLKRTEELEKSGKKFEGGFPALALVAGPEWEALSAEKKAEYKELANKANKERGFGRAAEDVDDTRDVGGNETRLAAPMVMAPRAKSSTSTSSRNQFKHMTQWESKVGSEERNIPLSAPRKLDMSLVLRQQVEREDIMAKEIRAAFYDKCLCHPDEISLPHTKNFLVIHFGNYYTNYLGAHPAEFCIAEFSVRDGINNCVSRLLDPGKVPLGFQTEFREAMRVKGYELPGFDPALQFDKECLDIIEMMMSKHTSSGNFPGVLYTTRAEIETVGLCLEFILKALGRPSLRIKIFPLSRLIELLLIEGESLRMMNNGTISGLMFSEEMAISLLLRSGLDYVQENSCNFHRTPAKIHTMSHCSMNLVKRWIYNSLPLLTRMYCCPMYLYNHVPKSQKTGFFYIDRALGGWANISVERKARQSSVSSSSTDLFGSETATAPSAYDSEDEHSLSFSSSRVSSAMDGVYEEENEPVQRSCYATHQQFPSLEKEAISYGRRGLDVKVMPDMNDRGFPDRGHVTVTVLAGNYKTPGTSSQFESAFERRGAQFFTSGENDKFLHSNEHTEPQDSGFFPTIQVFELQEKERIPVSTNYDLPSCNNVSNQSDNSSLSADDQMSSISKTFPRMSKDEQQTLEQAHDILSKGVMPTTKFIQGSRVFWDTIFRGEEKEQTTPLENLEPADVDPAGLMAPDNAEVEPPMLFPDAPADHDPNLSIPAEADAVSRVEALFEDESKESTNMDMASVQDLQSILVNSYAQPASSNSTVCEDILKSSASADIEPLGVCGAAGFSNLQISDVKEKEIKLLGTPSPDPPLSSRGRGRGRHLQVPAIGADMSDQPRVGAAGGCQQPLAQPRPPRGRGRHLISFDDVDPQPPGIPLALPQLFGRGRGRGRGQRDGIPAPPGLDLDQRGGVSSVTEPAFGPAPCLSESDDEDEEDLLPGPVAIPMAEEPVGLLVEIDEDLPMPVMHSVLDELRNPHIMNMNPQPFMPVAAVVIGTDQRSVDEDNWATDQSENGSF